jgi:uncharacterized protein YjlB
MSPKIGSDSQVSDIPSAEDWYATSGANGKSKWQQNNDFYEIIWLSRVNLTSVTADDLDYNIYYNVAEDSSVPRSPDLPVKRMTKKQYQDAAVAIAARKQARASKIDSFKIHSFEDYVTYFDYNQVTALNQLYLEHYSFERATLKMNSNLLANVYSPTPGASSTPNSSPRKKAASQKVARSHRSPKDSTPFPLDITMISMGEIDRKAFKEALILFGSEDWNNVWVSSVFSFLSDFYLIVRFRL